MSAPRVRLRREQQTMLMTLAMHARDAGSARPILGDRFAAGLLDRVDAAAPGGTGLDGNTPVICTRAALIDDAARRVLAAHDEAVVLHLGCGLDSRVLRVDPGPGVRWFEVDQEPVIALRRRLYDDRPGVTTIAASVTDPSWWSEVPDDLPRLVLAEGLLMYLDPAGVRTVVGTSLAPGATLVADTVAPWVARIAGWQPAMRAADSAFRSSSDDLTAAAADATLREELSVSDQAMIRTDGPMSVFLRFYGAVPAARRSMVLRTYAA